MDILILFLLNTLLFAIASLLLARRFDKLYNTQAFLRSVENEAKLIMTSLNQNADEQLAILEDRILVLENLRKDTDQLLHRLESIKGEKSAQIQAPQILDPVIVQEEPSTKVAEPQILEGMDKRQQALVLFQAGLSPQIISQRTGIPLGEVELIIRFMGRT